MSDFIPVGVTAVVENVGGFIADLGKMANAVTQFYKATGKSVADVASSKAKGAQRKATADAAAAAKVQQTATVGAAAAGERLAASASETAQQTARASANTADLAEESQKAARTQAELADDLAQAAAEAEAAQRRRIQALENEQRRATAFAARQRMAAVAGTGEAEAASSFSASLRVAQNNLRALRASAAEVNAELRRIGTSVPEANRLSAGLRNSSEAATRLAHDINDMVNEMRKMQTVGSTIRSVLSSAFSGAGGAITEVASRVKGIGAAISAISGPLKKQRGDLEALQQSLRSLTSRYQQLQSQAAKTAAAQEKLAQEAEQLQGVYDRLGQRIDDVTREIEELNAVSARADDSELGSNRDVGRWESTMTRLQTTLASLQKQQQDVGARMANVNSAMANAAGAGAQAGAAMGSLRSTMAGVSVAIGSASRIVGVLSKALGALAVVGFGIVGAMKAAQLAISALGGAARLVSGIVSGIGGAFSGGFKLIGQAIALPHRLLQGFGDVVQRISSQIERQANSWFKYGNSLRFFGQSLIFIITLPIAGFLGALTREAIAFEEAWAGVVKTVNDLDFQIVQAGSTSVNDLTSLGRNLQQMFLQLARVIPLPTAELLRIGQIAGQLGVKGVANLQAFVTVAAQLGVTTDVSAEAAATSLARLIAVSGGVSDAELRLVGFSQAQIEAMSSSERFQQSIRLLGGVLVHLGNNLAATESEILKLAEKIAAAGNVIGGFTAAQVLGIAAAFRSAGIAAEKGGTAFTKILFNIGEAVLTGNENLAIFAKTAGLAANEFVEAWGTDPVDTFRRFVEGLAVQGDKAINTFIGLGEESARLREAFLAVSKSGVLTEIFTSGGTRGFGLLAEAIANTSDELNALEIEAALRFSTTQSQLQLLKNSFTEVGVTVGTYVLPQINKMAQFLIVVANVIGDIDPEIQKIVIGILLFAAALGPAVIGLGLFLSSLGFILQTAASIVGVFGTLFSVFGGITIPILTVAGALGAVVVGLGAAAIGAYQASKAWEAMLARMVPVRDTIEGISTSLTESSGQLGGTLGRVADGLNEATTKIGLFRQAEKGLAADTDKATAVLTALGIKTREVGAASQEASGQIGGLMGSLAEQATTAASATREAAESIGEVNEGLVNFSKQIGVSAGRVARASALIAKAPDMPLQRLQKRMFEYGKNAVVSFARGMAVAIGAILKVIAAIGRVIARFLKPGSPPKLLPDLDEWGRQAMLSWMEGWASADFDIFNQIADRIETIIRSTTPDGGPEMMERIFASREVIAEIIDEIGRFGEFTEEHMRRIEEAMGGVSENTENYIRRLFELNAATQAVGRAQEDLNRITKRYEQALIPLERRLAAISARQKEVQDQARIVELEAILADVSSSDLAKELAGLELEQIGIEADVSGLKNKQDIETQLAQARLAAAQAEAEAAQELLAAAEALLDVQDENNQLWAELLDMIEELKEGIEDAAEAMKDAAEEIGDAMADIADGFTEDLEDDLGDIDLSDELDLDDEMNSLADQINDQFRKIFRQIQTEFKPVMKLWEDVKKDWLPALNFLSTKILEFLPSIDQINEAFGRIDTATTNFANALEVRLVPVMADVLRILEDLGLIDASWRDVFDQEELDTLTGGLWENYVKIKEIVTSIENFLAPRVESGKKWIGEFLAGFETGKSTPLSGVLTSIEGQMGKIDVLFGQEASNTLSGLVSDFVENGFSPELAGQAIGLFFANIKTKIGEGLLALTGIDFGKSFTALETALTNIGNRLETFFQGVIAGVTGMSDQLPEDDPVRKIAESIEFLGANITLAKEIIGGGLEFIKGVIGGFLSVLKTVGEDETIVGFATNIQENFATIREAFVDFVARLEESGFLDKMQQALGLFGGIIGIVAGLIASGAAAVITGIASAISELAAVLVPAAFDALGDLAQFMLDSSAAAVEFKNNIPEAWDALMELLNGIAETFDVNLIETVSTFWQDFTGLPLDQEAPLAANITTLVQAGITAVVMMIPNFFSAGVDIVQGLIDGISSVDIASIIGGIAGSVASTFKEALGITSPSTVMQGFGSNTMLGLLLGMQMHGSAIVGAMQLVTNQLLAVVITWSAQMVAYFTETMIAISAAVSEGQEKILEYFQKIVEDVLILWEEDFLEPLIGDGGIFDQLIEALDIMFEEMVNTVKKKVDDAIQYVLRRFIEMAEAIKGFRDEMEEAASEMMDGLLAGVKAVGAEVAAEAIAIANSIEAAFKAALDMILAVQAAAQNTDATPPNPPPADDPDTSEAGAPLPGQGPPGRPGTASAVPPWWGTPAAPPPVVVPAHFVSATPATAGPVINMGGQTINNGIDGHRLVHFIEMALADAVRYRTK